MTPPSSLRRQLHHRGLRLSLYQQFVFLAVDDDSRYLLVHEDEDGAEKRRDGRSQDGPPRVATYRVDQPTPVVSGGLSFPFSLKSGKVLI